MRRLRDKIHRLSYRPRISEGGDTEKAVSEEASRPEKGDIHHGFQQVYPVPNPKGKGRDESAVDIIAIHGLETSAPTTWQYRCEEDEDGKPDVVNWLSDENMLPKFVPNARIFTYNWHANYSRASVDLTLQDHAYSFLLDLRAARQKEDEAFDRPVVFIASCFGGLVVIKALTIAASAAGQDYSFLRQATVGIAFLGTPFKGSPAQRLAQWLLAFQGFVGESGSGTLLKDLKTSTGVLNDLNDQFMREAHRPYYHLPMHCFYETRPTNLSKKILPGDLAALVSLKKLMVTQDSACLDGWDHTPLDCNHTMMNKFAPDWENFKRVASVIQKFVFEAEDTLEQRNRLRRDNASTKASPAENNFEVRHPTPQRHHFLVPFGRNKGFVGRGLILESLLSRIPPTTDEDDCQRTVIEGLGGVGKTQIALEAVYRVHKMDPECSVFWVPAVNSSMFEQAYREIGRKLDVPGIDDSTADVKSLVKAALEEGSAGRWLLVVDNLDDPELVSGKKGVGGAIDHAPLAEYLPFSHQGSILITTRNHAVAVALTQSVRGIIAVEEMNAADALQFLNTDLKEEQTGDTASSQDLLRFLCNLPLAIRQASAYITKNQITVAEYLGFCESSDKDMVDMLSKDFEDRYRYSEIQNPVATTWLISFRHILAQDPLAATYLRYMCFLAEKDIPQSLLPQDDKIKMAEAIGTLKSYAFINERDGPNAYDMHRLVRMSMLNWLALQGKRGEWQTKVFKGLEVRFPRPSRDNKNVWERYLPHVQHAIGVSGEAQDKIVLARLYHRLGRCYYLLCKLSSAERIYKKSIIMLREALGEDNDETILNQMDLARVYDREGKFQEAIILHEKVLSVRERRLGTEHLLVAETLQDLAQLFENSQKYDDAERLRRRALQVRQKIFGERHARTLTAKSRLAACLVLRGKFEEADHIHRQALKDSLELLGEEHKSTLQCMKCLARSLRHQGKLSEAEILNRRALKVSQRIFGMEDPNTVDLMYALARILQEQNKHAEAGDILSQLVELSERVLGRDHVGTLQAQRFLAEVLYVQGNYEEAEKLLRQAVESTQGIIQTRQVLTADLKLALIGVLSTRGKFNEAEELLRRLLTTLESQGQVEEVKRLQTDLVFNLQCQGKFEEAKQEREKLIATLESQGKIEEVEKLRVSLIKALRYHGKFDEAERPREELFTTLRSRGQVEKVQELQMNLILSLQYHGRFEEAEQPREDLTATLEAQGKIEEIETLRCHLVSDLKFHGKVEDAERVRRRYNLPRGDDGEV